MNYQRGLLSLFSLCSEVRITPHHENGLLHLHLDWCSIFPSKTAETLAAARVSGVASFSATLVGTAEGIRTPDLLVRSQSLYPAELWAHFLLRTVVLTTITIISHLLQLVKRFFEFFSGFSKKVCIARNFGVFCLGE